VADASVRSIVGGVQTELRWLWHWPTPRSIRRYCFVNHPIIGIWVVEMRYPDRPLTDRGTLLFHEDGSLSVAFPAFSAHAAWKASGERSADVTGVRPVGPNEGFVGWYTLQATATVSDDGRSCHIPGVQSRPRPDGTLVEQQLTITGTRLSVA
jgi:hypothetical protein